METGVFLDMRTYRKIVITLIIFLCCFPCLFADTNFTLSLDYNIIRGCGVSFWQPNTIESFSASTVDVSSKIADGTVFASLGIIYSGETTISLDLGWTPFYLRTRNNNDYVLHTSSKCDYTLGLTTKGSSNLYCWESSDPQTENGFMYGYQVKYKKKKLVEQKIPRQLGILTDDNDKRLIADLYISGMNLDGLESGEYVSFLICYITVN